MALQTSMIASKATPQLPRRAARTAVRAQAARESAPSAIEKAATRATGAAGLVAAELLMLADPAMAKGGELGILEGRTIALLHPAAMWGALASTVYGAYLGWQWRRTRTIGDEIKGLKAALPKPAEGEEAPTTPEIKALEEERKELVKGGFKDRHTAVGFGLLGAGVLFSIEGGLNTYIRTGKLFPGPHLYAGAGITVLWALAASLTPQMQKGNETARSLHIALNTIATGLFLWQVPTGLQIVGKVFEFTSWP